MNLSEFRQQNPAYSDTEQWPDQKLADGLYNKFYSDMDRAEFDTMISPPQVDPRDVEQAPREKMNFFKKFVWRVSAFTPVSATSRSNLNANTCRRTRSVELGD